MIAAIDFAKLLESPESIVTLVVAGLGLLGTLLNFLGKRKAAKAALAAKDAVAEKKKAIIELGDLITVLVKGVDKAKDTFRSYTQLKGTLKDKGAKAPDKNIGAIIEEHADTVGMKDILNAKVAEIHGSKGDTTEMPVLTP
jgi:hypothetical protein